MSHASPEPSEDICEVCRRPAESHLTEIDRAGQVTVRHVCFDHDVPEQVLDKMPDELKAIRKRHIEEKRRRLDGG